MRLIKPVINKINTKMLQMLSNSAINVVNQFAINKYHITQQKEQQLLS